MIYPPLAAVHVSGHASQEEQKLMLSLTRPRFFVPIHGELRHLHAHAALARQLGIPSENIFIVENGTVLEFTADSATIVGACPSGDVFVDGSGVGDIGPKVMAEREALGPRRLRDRDRAGQRGDRRGQRQAGAGLARVRLPAGERGSDGDARPSGRGAPCRQAAPRSGQAIIERTQETLGRFFYEETRRKPMVVAVVTQGVTGAQ